MAGDGARFLRESGTGAFCVKLNTQKAPLDDVHRRLALAATFDDATAVTQIAEGVAGGVPATGAIPVGMPGANPREEAPARDMDAARAHLAQCAHDPADHVIGRSWVAEVATEERFALLMRSNFAELGFETEIVRVPWVLFTERVTSPGTTPHVSRALAAAAIGDPDTRLCPTCHPSVAGTWCSPERLADPDVDRLLEEGRTAPTPEGRGGLPRPRRPARGAGADHPRLRPRLRLRGEPAGGRAAPDRPGPGLRARHHGLQLQAHEHDRVAARPPGIRPRDRLAPCAPP